MRYSLGDLNPKREPSPEQKRNEHLVDSGIALSANGDDGRSAVSRASTANTEVSTFIVRDNLIIKRSWYLKIRWEIHWGALYYIGFIIWRLYFITLGYILLYFQSSRPSVIRKSERGLIYIMDSVTRDYHLETESDSRSFFAPIPIQRTLPPVEPIRCAASLPPRPVKRSRPHR